MTLPHKHVGSKISAKKIYILSRAELLITLYYEIPCSDRPKGFFTVLGNPNFTIFEVTVPCSCTGQISKTYFTQGVIQCGHNFALFRPPTYLNVENSYPKRGQKRRFFGPPTRLFLSKEVFIRQVTLIPVSALE